MRNFINERCGRPICTIAVSLGIALIAGCASMTPEQEALVDDAFVIAHYFHGYADGTITFEAGPYEGGTAVFNPDPSGKSRMIDDIPLPIGRAFWVKDGIGYTVNGEAQEVAPELGKAPSQIVFDLNFVAAAIAGL